MAQASAVHPIPPTPSSVAWPTPALRPPLAHRLLQPVVSRALRVLHRKHPRVLERLTAFAGACVAVTLTDLPLCAVFYIEPNQPRLVIFPQAQRIPTDATIHTSLDTLCRLIEGKIDGDAVFFGRGLTLEGRTELVVAIRNAVDGEGIDLAADLKPLLGPLARPASVVARRGAAVFAALTRTAQAAHKRLAAPMQNQCDAQAAELNRLRDRVAVLEKQIKRVKRTREDPPLSEDHAP